MPLAKVIAERPDVFNHNVEVVPRLYPVARRGSTWERSLRVLSNAKEMGGDEVVTKSGLMVGLGETLEEMVDAFGQLREQGVQVLTVGQYLRPTERHLPVVRYWHPDEFKALEAAAYDARLRAHRRRPAGALQLPRRRARQAGPAGRRPGRRAPADVAARAGSLRARPCSRSRTTSRPSTFPVVTVALIVAQRARRTSSSRRRDHARRPEQPGLPDEPRRLRRDPLRAHPPGPAVRRRQGVGTSSAAAASRGARPAADLA